jgi:hypothetical protein
MAEKVICLKVNQQHTLDGFSLIFLCSLPLSEHTVWKGQISNFLKIMS